MTAIKVDSLVSPAVEGEVPQLKIAMKPSYPLIFPSDTPLELKEFGQARLKPPAIFSANFFGDMLGLDARSLIPVMVIICVHLFSFSPSRTDSRMYRGPRAFSNTVLNPWGKEVTRSWL